MKIVSFFIKLWLVGLGIFMFITYIIPRDRPYANGCVYINSRKTKNNKDNILFFQNINITMESLSTIRQWADKNSLDKIVFYVPQYEVGVLYCYLKQQNLLFSNRIVIGVMEERINVTRIFFLYHQTLGLIIEIIGQTMGQWIYNFRK